MADMKHKLIFNITFHQQFDNLKFHVDRILNWTISDDIKFMFTSAHESNLDKIEKYVELKYPHQNVSFFFIDKDHGYNLGTIMNVTKGLEYIAQNEDYDYVVNVEGDNMFFFEDKLIKIINQMKLRNKHMLLIEEGFGRAPHRSIQGAIASQHPKWFHFTTLNIFSKFYLDNYFPFDLYAQVIDIRHCNRPYTPYEAYMGLATMIKNNLSESNQMDWYNKVGLRLDYNRDANPKGWSEPDNMVPEKFLKWGVINAPSTAGGEQGDANQTWVRTKHFIDLHMPLYKEDGFLCRSCASSDLNLILDLGEQPWCNDFLTKEQIGKENKYALRLFRCENCELLQIDTTIPKETMFGDHCYLSGITSTLRDHFFEVAKENVEQFKLLPDDLVVDIGGNDGTQLLQYKKAGISNILNIECAKRISDISRKAGVKTLTEYFNKQCAKNHLGEGSVKLFNASGVFFHLEELHSVIEGIEYSLADNGVLIVQFMYAGAMIDNKNFDTIYHEHLCYYTIHSLQNLLSPYGLEIFDSYHSPIHSGSIISKIGHIGKREKTKRHEESLERDKSYTKEKILEFAKQVEASKDKLKATLQQLKSDGKTIYAYGAPAKGNTLLNYFKIGKDLIDQAVEVNELKIGTYLPGSHIPVVKEDPADLPDYYLLLSHNFEKAIIDKNKGIINKGVQFITPFVETL
tara:strand:- start:203 stop:2257 length:2055 start_codon:yes stop_codon:yes gene_type:complete